MKEVGSAEGGQWVKRGKGQRPGRKKQQQEEKGKSKSWSGGDLTVGYHRQTTVLKGREGGGKKSGEDIRGIS